MVSFCFPFQHQDKDHLDSYQICSHVCPRAGRHPTRGSTASILRAHWLQRPKRQMPEGSCAWSRFGLPGMCGHSGQCSLSKMLQAAAQMQTTGDSEQITGNKLNQGSDPIKMRKRDPANNRSPCDSPSESKGSRPFAAALPWHPCSWPGSRRSKVHGQDV